MSVEQKVDGNHDVYGVNISTKLFALFRALSTPANFIWHSFASICRRAQQFTFIHPKVYSDLLSR